MPEDIRTGSYELFLRMPAPEPRLKQRTEYSIQFANDGIWNPQTTEHDLMQEIEVVESTRSEAYSGHLQFVPLHID